MAGPIYGEGFVDLAPRLTDSALGGLGSKLSAGMGPVATAAGGVLVAGLAAAVAGGAAIIAGSLQEGIAREASLDLSGARLGLSEEDTARIGEAAGSAYVNAFGDSVIDNQAVATEALRRFRDVSDAELGALTEGALGLEEVFGVGFEQTLEAAQQLLVNGLAPSAEEALDIVASGLQNSTGDVEEALSAINEYSTSFGLLGLSGENVLGALSSEFATNQFAIDKAGDAIKELGIRAIDGSTGSTEALEAIGLTTEEVSAAFAEGGDVAGDMSKRIISSITAIEDPAERAQLGVALMGTPFEDLGQNAVPILDDLVAGTDDFAGATDSINDQAFDNVGSRISGAWRSIKEATIGAVNETLLPAFASLTEWFADRLPAAIDAVRGFFEPVLAFFGTFASGLGEGSTSLGKFGEIASRIGETVMLVFGALADFWAEWGDEITSILSTIFETVWGVISAALDVIIGIFDVVLGILSGDWGRAWEGIQTILSGAWDAITTLVSGAFEILKTIFSGALEALGGIVSDGFENLVEWFTELPGRIVEALGDLGSLLVDAGGDLVRGLWDGVKALGSWLADKLSSWVTQWIPGPIARALGISSPSKVAAELGRAVSQGLAGGILDDESLVRSASSALASSAIPPLEPGLAASISSATAMRRARGFDSQGVATGGIHVEAVVNNPIGEPTEDSLSRALSAALHPYVNI